MAFDRVGIGKEIVFAWAIFVVDDVGPELETLESTLDLSQIHI